MSEHSESAAEPRTAAGGSTPREEATPGGHAAPEASEVERPLNRPLVLAAMMLAIFMAAIEATIVATAMPTIVADLGGFRLFSWVYAVFLLVQAVTTPVYGKLADMYGRKPVLFAGTGAFLAASLAAGFAQTMTQLIAFRALQGLGAGAIFPVALTIVGDIYTPAERARIQGWLAGVWGFSSVVGPALGAFFVEHLHWALVFWVNLPVGALAIGMTAAFFTERVPRKEHRLDLAGAGLMTAGTAALMLALIQGAEMPGWLLAALVLVAAVGLVGFVRQERRSPEPMMPLDIWRVPVIATANMGSGVGGALMFGVVTFLPAYVQGVMGQSPAAAGFTLAMMSIGWPLASTIGGRVMVHTSYRTVALTGALALLAGAGVLVAMQPHYGPVYAGLGAFLIGTGMGCTASTYLVAVQTAVPWQRRGVSTSTNLFLRIVGQGVGSALCGAVLNATLAARVPQFADRADRLLDATQRAAMAPDVLESLRTAMVEGLRYSYSVTLVLALVAGALAWRLPRRMRPGDA